MSPEMMYDTQNIIPLNDLFPHSYGEGCAYHPKIVPVIAYEVIVGKLIVHSSWDRREVYERLKFLWPTYEGFGVYK